MTAGQAAIVALVKAMQARSARAEAAPRCQAGQGRGQLVAQDQVSDSRRQRSRVS